MDQKKRSRRANDAASDAVESPFSIFDAWYRAAQEAGTRQPEAMVLSTVGAGGGPSSRVVLMRGHDERGIVFHTNYRSRKGKELLGNGAAALVFWWPLLGLQVRIEGRAVVLPAAESDEYFQSRPRGHRLGAWASRQSLPVAERAVLAAAYAKVRARYAGKDIPRPPHWGGFRLEPALFEFWEEQPNRLHDRLEYRKTSRGRWTCRRLQP